MAKLRRWCVDHTDLFETIAWALVIWSASIFIIWRVAPK